MDVNDDANDGVRDANKSPLLEDRSDSGPATSHPASAADFSSVKAIYFDLDDTLCGYWDASKAGLRRAFELEGPKGYTVEECVKAWATAFREFAPTLKHTGWYEGYLKEAEPTRTEQMRRMLLKFGIVDEGLAQRLSERYMTERDQALKLFEDAWEVVTTLRKRFPLGLITNGPADLQRMEVATLGLEPFFDPILIEGEMGEGKPKPAVFQRAADLMRCTPDQLLMVGNSYHHDVLPALEAGWKAIWIRRPSDVPPSSEHVDPKPEERPEHLPEPDAVINDLRSLLPLLRSA
jgi:putative hydrolase of the HAD superfamily